MDAALILGGLLGVLLVAAFSTYSGRDDEGYGTIIRPVDLEYPRWGSRRFLGLDWKTADRVSRWVIRVGWVLIVVAAIVQIVRVSQAEN